MVLDGAGAAVVLQAGQGAPAQLDLAQLNGGQQLTIDAASLADHSASQEADQQEPKDALEPNLALQEGALKTVATAMEGSATPSFLQGGALLQSGGGAAIESMSLAAVSSTLQVTGSNLVFTDIAGDEDNRLVVSSDGTHLTIRDENAHNIDLLTALPGAIGSGGNELSIPLASLAGVTGLVLNTHGGNDSVTFDLSANADSILAQFVTATYNGGANTASGDKLRFVGDGVTSSVYSPDRVTTGSGVVVVSSPTQTLTFSFLALEPVDFTGMAEAKLVTPATATDVLTVAPGVDSLSGLVDALVVSGTVGGTVIETGHFFGNHSVVILTDIGPDGNDSIDVLGAANAHGNSNLSIDTNPFGQDSVQISGNVTLAGQLSVNTALLSIQSIVSLGGPALIATRGDTIFGAAGQLHASQVTIAAGGAITLVDGALINAGAGTIALSAVGNITLGRLVTTNANSYGGFDSFERRQRRGRRRQRRTQHRGRGTWRVRHDPRGTGRGERRQPA